MGGRSTRGRHKWKFSKFRWIPLAPTPGSTQKSVSSTQEKRQKIAFVLNWRVCWTVALFVLNWRIWSVADWFFGCYLCWTQVLNWGGLCWTKGFNIRIVVWNFTYDIILILHMVLCQKSYILLEMLSKIIFRRGRVIFVI